MKPLLSAAISDHPRELSSLSRRRSDGLPDSLSTPLSNALRTDSAPVKLPFGRRATDFVECPKCGKRSIVTRNHNTFDCLNCNFHREFPPVKRSASRSVAHPARPLNPLMPSGSAYRYPLDLAEMEPESESGQPLLFAAIAVIFGILLL